MRTPDRRVSDQYHEKENWRTSANVDIDRLLYSPEFRRLSGVTQVIPPQVDYQFHDRLTHSVKVAQVASSLARQLLSTAADSNELPEDVKSALAGWVDPDYCYVAALAHDIGHPPFGHAGENALQQYCERLAATLRESTSWEGGDEKSDLDPWQADLASLLERRSFEGNAQSMRVVSRLAFRSRSDENGHGLNLTLRAIAGIAKYPWLRGGHPSAIEKLAKKWSFYDDDEDLLSLLTNEQYVSVVTDIEGRVTAVHRWVEAEIMDWADDISYAVHDLDDFFRAGLIPLDQISHAFATAGKQDWLATDFSFVQGHDLRETFKFIRARLIDHVKSLQEVDTLSQNAAVTEAFTQLSNIFWVLQPESFSGTRNSYASLRQFSSSVIRYLSSSCTLVYLADLERIQLSVALPAVLVAEFFKLLNKLYVIQSAMLAIAQYGQSEDISVLCDSLAEVSESWLASENTQDAASRRLPPHLREYLRDSSAATNLEDVAQSYMGVLIAVFDYLCSLTDYQASRLAAHLRSSSAMGVLDGRWLDL